jgi:hypothetical protein
MTVDWRAMFKKYAYIVGSQEGIYYLDSRGGYQGDDPWTDEEWAAIEEVIRELDE